MVLATSAKLALVWSGWPETTLIADDAYYYFTIARNLARGLGPTFDGLAPTNGFHPLWQAILVPFFAGESLWLPVRAALSLTACFDLLSAWILWRWVAEQSSDTSGAWAAGIWLLSPISFLLGLRGLEASLLASLVFATLWRASRASASATELGILVGLASLARTDAPLTVGLPIALVLLIPAFGGGAPRLRELARTGLIGGAIFAPWLLWSWIEFGHPVQVSGLIRNHAHGMTGSTPWDFASITAAASSSAALLFGFALTPLRWLAGMEFEPGRWWLPIAAGWIVAATLLAASGTRALWRDGARRTVVLMLGFLFVHQLLYGGLLRAYLPWYALPAHGLLAVAFGSAIARRRGRFSGVHIAAGLLLGCNLALAACHRQNLAHGARGAEAFWGPRLDAVLAVAPNAHDFGLWDAGAAGYVATARPGIRIVNLDGLVNNRVLEAIREDRYSEYVLQNVDYLLQHPRRAAVFLSEDETARFVEAYESSRATPRR